MSIKSLSIRIDDEMLDKLHYVADYEARSANGQIIVLIRECIEKFEEKHGKIVLGDEPDNANSIKNRPIQSPKGQSNGTIGYKEGLLLCGVFQFGISQYSHHG